MQVRRYIDEGKFTEQNQIPLLHALDCRMVAEKIKRTAEIINSLSSPKEKNIHNLVKETKDFYSKSFLYFYNHEFEKAIRIIDNEKELLGKIVRLNRQYKNKKMISELEQLQGLKWIVTFSRNIDMLTR